MTEDFIILMLLFNYYYFLPQRGANLRCLACGYDNETAFYLRVRE